MIERAIADWLTSATERYYQRPFAQVLLAEGHEVLYVSSHGQMEQGKDIITRAPSGEYHAYQLKRGAIGLAEWRSMEGEVRELRDVPIAFPLVDKHEVHKSFLVTNGTVSDPVRRAIDDVNQVAAGRGLPEVGVIQAEALVRRFVDAGGSFLPSDIPDLGRFLDLLRKDGCDFIDKQALFEFVMNTFFSAGERPRTSDAKHAVTSAAVVVAYLLAPYQRAANHYALFEAWTLLASTVLWYGRANGLDRATYEPTFVLAVEEAASSLRLLTAEVLERENYLEGDGMGDGGALYRGRVCVCLGAVACSLLSDRLADAAGEFPETAASALERLLADEGQVLYYGDATAPHALYMALFLEAMGRRDVAEELVARHIRGVTAVSSPWSDTGIPNPYYSPDRIALANQRLISRMMGLTREFDDELDVDFKQFQGVSWALEGFVQMAARRGMRSVLEENWCGISHVQYAEFRPESDAEYLLFRCEHGHTADWFPNPEQSWRELQAESSVEDAPDWVSDYPAFSCMFALVFPHRCNARLVRVLDQRS